MFLIGVLAYIADVACVGAFFLLQRNTRYRRLYMATNFLAAFPLGVVEWRSHNWQAFILNDAFGLIGLKGMLTRVA